MHSYYPPIKPYTDHRISVDQPHEIYVEECGSPDGLPILVVHGGPGSGCDVDLRRFFDPEVYRIILFDQRGCGRSTPHAELTGNTTQALVEDMESIRETLNINKWYLFGGSWGATLSLVYAQTHPERVCGMILRGIFLGRVQDVEWFIQDGANQVFPDYWQDFLAPVQHKRSHILKAYFEKLTGDNELARMSAAKAWSTWEARCATLQPQPRLVDNFNDPAKAVSLASIECHYFINHCFLEDNQILHNMNKIKDIPAIIVHGRYDMVCPLHAAWELHKAWPTSELFIVRDAGHAASEPGTTDALILATQQMAKQLNPHA